MSDGREPMAGRVAGPLRTGVAWGMLALAATGVLALLVGSVGAAVTWVQQLFGSSEFRWPGDLVTATAAVGLVLSIPTATWAVSYASTLSAPQGRALLATGLGVAAMLTIATIDQTVALTSGAVMAFAVALPFDPWHRLVFRIFPGVVAVLAWAAFAATDGPLVAVLAAVAAYPAAGLLVWLGDAAWRALPMNTPSSSRQSRFRR